MSIATAGSVIVADGLGWGHMGGSGWGGWLIGWFMMVGFVLLVIWAVRDGVGSGASSDRRGALDVLAERFARGEITSDEYRERHDVLAAASKRKGK